MIAAERPQQIEHQENLNLIATQINTQTDKLAASVRTTVEAARQIGVYLTEAKKLLKETGTAFEAWVGEHCRFSYPTACRYVRLADKWDQFTDEQKGNLSIPQLLDQVAGYRRPARHDGAQPGAENPEALTVLPSNTLSGPPEEVVPLIKIMGTEVTLDGHSVTETRAVEADQKQTQDGPEEARPIQVTYAQVHQAAAKHELDHLLAAVPTDRLAGFLAELGVVVKSDPVPAAP